MARTVSSFTLCIVGGLGVAVVNKNCDWGAQGKTLFNARDDSAQVKLGSWTCEGVLSGTAPIEFALNHIHRQRQTCRAAIDTATHRDAVRLAKCADPENDPSLTCHRPLRSVIECL